MKSNQQMIKHHAPFLAKRYALLQDTCDDLGLERSEQPLDSGFEGHVWYFGIEIRKSELATSPVAKALSKTGKPKARGIAWFGYQGDEQECDLAVWCYCGTRADRDSVEKRLKPKDGVEYDLRHKDDEAGRHLFAVRRVKSSNGDKAWFLSVFRQPEKGGSAIVP
jgi:hypothetical protein